MFFEKQCQKKPKFLDRVAQKKKSFCKMLNNKSELTNWAQNTKHKNTNWHQNLSQKSSKKPIFVVRKWAPQEVVLFLTLEVVPKLTLERPKSGTKTNSPAYIYIALTPPGGHVWVTNLKKSPVSEQNWPQIDTHLEGERLSCLGICLLLLLCLFLSLILHISLYFLTF